MSADSSFTSEGYDGKFDFVREQRLDDLPSTAAKINRHHPDQGNRAGRRGTLTTQHGRRRLYPGDSSRTERRNLKHPHLRADPRPSTVTRRRRDG